MRVAGIAVLGVLLSAATAQANSYCAGSPSGSCDASFAGNASGLTSAIAAAASNPGADTVLIGPGSYAGEFSYEGGDGKVTIRGSGTGQTTLSVPSAVGQQTGLALDGGNSVSDLTITIPPQPDNAVDTGLDLTGASAMHVNVSSPSGDQVTGVIAHASSFSGGSISLPLNPPNGSTGMVASDNSTLADSTISANYGLFHLGSPGLPMTISRSKVTAAFEGIDEKGGTLNVDDTLIQIVLTPPLQGVGLAADNRGDNTSTTPMLVNASHLTIVGGGPFSAGLKVVAKGSGPGAANATANLADSVINGPGLPIQLVADNTRTATSNTNYSNYDAATVSQESDADGTGATGSVNHNAQHRTNLDPGFVDGPGGDFHLLSSSALIDAGDPAAGGPGLDLDGNTRVLPGKLDCTTPAHRDIGAYEFVPPGSPPNCPGNSTNPQTKIGNGPKGRITRHRVTFRFSSTTDGSTFQCKLDNRPAKPCTSPRTYRVGAGRHLFQVVAIGPTGLVDPSPAVRRFRVVD
jgi:hypothetical protein